MMTIEKLGVTGLLSLVMIASGCKSKPKQAVAAAPSDPNVVTVTPGLEQNLKFGSAKITDVTGTLQIAARVETDARRIARVGSPVAGRILTLRVFEGQNIHAGSTLATLHSTNLSDTQVELIRAESQQQLAVAGVKRAELLVDSDVIGRAE